jgi:hypothetical protein
MKKRADHRGTEDTEKHRGRGIVASGVSGPRGLEAPEASAFLFSVYLCVLCVSVVLLI